MYNETIIKDTVKQNNELLHSLAITIDGLKETILTQSKNIREIKAKLLKK